MAADADDPHREISVRHRERRPRRGGAAGPARRAAAAAAECRARGDRQAGAAAGRPRQGHRRNALHRGHHTARHAARPDSALALPHAQVRGDRHSAAARHPGVRAVMLVARPDDPASRGRALCRRAGRRGRRRFHGGGRRGAAPDPRRLQATAVRRGHGQGARSRRAARSTTALRRPPAILRAFPLRAGLPLNGNVRGPATDSRGDAAQGLCAKPTSSSRASIAPRCRPIAAWSRTRSSPIGGPTA